MLNGYQIHRLALHIANEKETQRDETMSKTSSRNRIDSDSFNGKFVLIKRIVAALLVACFVLPFGFTLIVLILFGSQLV